MLPTGAKLKLELSKKVQDFLDLFPNTVFAYLPEGESNKPARYSQILDLKLQQQGYGIYFSVNGFSEGRRIQANLRNVNAFFCDIDFPNKLDRDPEKVRLFKNELIQELAGAELLPTAIVQTKNGLHVYWVLTEPVLTPEDEEQRQKLILDYLRIEENILRRYGGDMGAKDITRVLRVPDTLHQKNPKDPFLCNLEFFNNELTYTYEEVRTRFSAVVDSDRWADTAGDNALDAELKAKIEKAWPKLERPSFKVLLNKKEGVPEGMRNKALLIAATVLRQSGKNLNEVMEYFDEYQGLSVREIQKTVRSAFDKEYDFGYNNEVMAAIVTPEEREQFNRVVGQAANSDQRKIEAANNKKQKEMYLVYEHMFADRHPLLKYKEHGDFYEYNSGVYNVVPLEDVRSMLFREMLQDGLLNYRKVSAISDKIAAFKSLEGRTFRQSDVDRNPHILNVQNGLLDIQKHVMHEHTPNYISLNQIPIDYNPRATAPRWEKFVAEVAREDQGQIRLLRQMAGYCLTTSTQYAKAFILFGPGGNGKSLFTRLLSKVIGKHNVSNLTLSTITDKFGLVGIVGKKMNVIDEISGHYFESNIVKGLIAGENQAADVKYRPEPLEFTPTAKLVFSVNELPKINDTTQGLYRRFIIIPFLRSFIGNPDTYLEDKLTAELPGILNWCIEGIKDLQDTGRFAETELNHLALKEFKSDNSPALEFLQMEYEAVAPDTAPRYAVELRDLYKRYQNYCRDNGYSPKALNRFTREIVDARYEEFPNLQKVIEPGGGRRTMIQGLRARENLTPGFKGETYAHK